MAQELKVLLIDDDEALTYGLLQELSGGVFYPISFLRVNTQNGLREALETRAWHIVVAGFTKTGLGGLAALKYLREAGRKTPLVVLTRSADELGSVDAKQSGAAEVLPVLELHRLGETVRRVLGVRPD